MTGCATGAPARQPIADDAQRILALLEEQRRDIPTLRTLADVSIQRGSDRQQLRAVVLAKAPASLRFEALSPLGQPLWLATIHDGRLTAYDTTTNEAHVGPATSDATSRLLGLPFEPEDLVAVLSGRVVPPSDVHSAEIRPADALGPSIEIAGANDRRRIWLDFTSGLVRRVEVSANRRMTITFARDAGGRMQGLDITAALSLMKASIRYTNPDFGGDVAPDLFSLVVPKGAKLQPIR